jgi:hypothetical protein
MTQNPNEYSADARAPGGGEPGILYYLAERAVVEALQSGWAYLLANPDQLTNVLRYADEVERAKVIAYLTSATDPPIRPEQITVGYPVFDVRAVQIKVAVKAEMPESGGDFLADNIGGMVMGGVIVGGGGPGTQRANLRRRNIEILITATQHDVVLYLDGIVDSIMYAQALWFQRAVEAGGAGLVSVEQGSKSAVEVAHPMADSGATRMWVLTSGWSIVGHAGTTLRLPPPKTRVQVHMAPVTAFGIRGGVIPRG